MQTHKPDLILLDLKSPDIDSLNAIDYIRENAAKAPIIIITGHGSISVAIEAMRRGARDFLVTPFNAERLQDSIRNELGKQNSNFFSMPQDLAGLHHNNINNLTPKNTHTVRPQKKSNNGFIGTSPAMLNLYDQIEHAAASQASVFITGETGTGKEVCAETIHRLSTRADKPFIALNCAAIPRDLIESELFGHIKGAFTGAIADREGAAHMADGGTLFLDEIAEMAPDMQTKLLRFLQNLTFMKVGSSRQEKTDTRIICATNRNPIDEMQSGRFREDLFYRLHVLPLHMPALRERGSDIIDIAQILLQDYTAEEKKSFSSISLEAENMLRHYYWPGNIRQLQNVIRHAVVMNKGSLLTGHMLSLPKVFKKHELKPATATATAENEDTIRPLEETERKVIEDAIRRSNGNIPDAAAKLGIAPSTIYRKKSAWDTNGHQ